METIDTDHHICHAFLSDAESGHAIKTFPSGGKIVSVCRVQRDEGERTWSCCGYPLDNGCIVTGIKFSFKDTAQQKQTNVIMHSWWQCKLIPFCGDPLSPKYAQLQTMQLTLNEPAMELLPPAVAMGKEVGFLPVDFLCVLLGHSFSFFDASGMEVMNPENFGYCESRLQNVVEQSLGIGH